MQPKQSEVVKWLRWISNNLHVTWSLRHGSTTGTQTKLKINSDSFCDVFTLRSVVDALNKLWQPINTKIRSKCALPRMKLCDGCVISLDKRDWAYVNGLLIADLLTAAIFWPTVKTLHQLAEVSRERRKSVDQIKICRMNHSSTQECSMSATRVLQKMSN